MSGGAFGCRRSQAIAAYAECFAVTVLAMRQSRDLSTEFHPGCVRRRADCMTAHHFPSIQPFLRPMNRFVIPLGMGAGLLMPLPIGAVVGWGDPVAIAQSSPSPLLLAQNNTPQGTSVLHVNPVSGDDNTADGSDQLPFKTITRALDVAPPQTVIQLAPGTYSTNTGETFPLALKPRVILQGNPDTRGQEVVIRGGGLFASPGRGQQNITILAGANQSGLIGVTVTNPNPAGYAIQVESSSPTIANSSFINNGRGGMIIVGSSTSTIRSNFFYQNGASSIRIQGTASPTVQENILEQSETGILVDDTAAPMILSNRITQNKIGITVQGQAKPKLRGNSVEGNEQFGLFAIASAQPDFKTTAESEANFFRNNGKQDIALSASGSPTTNGSKPTNAEPKQEIAEKAPPTESSPSTAVPLPVAKESSSPPPRDKAAPGFVVVPVVTTPLSQSAPPEQPVERVPAPPIARPTPPAVFPPPPATQAPPAIPLTAKPTPQPIPPTTSSSTTGITSQTFPVPAALSNSAPSSTKPRPIQVIPIESSVDRASVTAPEPALETITVPSTRQPGRSPGSTIPEPTISDSTKATGARPVVSTSRRLPTQPPVAPTLSKEIPAPPQFAPRPAVAPQHVPAGQLPVLQAPAAATAFPRPTTVPARPPTQAIPIPVPQAIPVPVPQAIPTRIVQPMPAPNPVVPQQAIEIPVPRPERDRNTPIPIRVPKATPSPIGTPPIASNSTSTKTSNLLPVPSASIPVGNIGDMPSVYSARGNRQPIPGIPINPATAGSVVVKYRVVVVATDNTQQEQVRSIIPDAFPIVYRGQRMWQAGAFGDRAKADQLVASLNTQGLQAIIEPLE